MDQLQTMVRHFESSIALCLQQREKKKGAKIWHGVIYVANENCLILRLAVSCLDKIFFFAGLH